MPTQKSSPQADWTMEDIYNMLMFDIEPELMTGVIPTLDSFYKKETKKQKKERMARYAKAFEEFARRFDVFMAAWKETLEQAGNTVAAYGKEKMLEQDKKSFADIERSLEDHDA